MLAPALVRGDLPSPQDELLPVGLLSPTQFPCQAKINDFDPMAAPANAHDVLRFEVQVDDALMVDILDPLQDLPHVLDTGGLCVLKVIIQDPFKQLPTRDAAREQGEGVMEHHSLMNSLLHPRQHWPNPQLP